MNKKNISMNNYLIVIGTMIFTIIFVLIGFKIYNNYKINLYNEPYLLKSKTLTLEVTSLDEIKNAFNETSSNYFVMISKSGDEEVYNLEKRLKPIIDEYNLKDIFYYIDATNFVKQENYLSDLNKALNLDNKIKDIPTILYFKDGLVKSDYIIEKEGILVGAFERLLDVIEYKK